MRSRIGARVQTRCEILADQTCDSDYRTYGPSGGSTRLDGRLRACRGDVARRRSRREEEGSLGVGGGSIWERSRGRGQRFWHPAASPNCLAFLASTASTFSTPLNPLVDPRIRPLKNHRLEPPPFSSSFSLPPSIPLPPPPLLLLFSPSRMLNKQRHLSHCAKRYICFCRTFLIIYNHPRERNLPGPIPRNFRCSRGVRGFPGKLRSCATTAN